MLVRRAIILKDPMPTVQNVRLRRYQLEIRVVPFKTAVQFPSI